MTHPQTLDDEALVEVMARAICEANGEDPEYAIELMYGGNLKPQWRLYILDATAALTALRNHEGRK